MLAPVAQQPCRATIRGTSPTATSTSGRRQLKIKQYDKAIASANKALALAPSAGAFALLGDVAAARGDCAAAMKHYAQALKLDPGEKHALEGRKACAGK